MATPKEEGQWAFPTRQPFIGQYSTLRTYNICQTPPTRRLARQNQFRPRVDRHLVDSIRQPVEFQPPTKLQLWIWQQSLDQPIRDVRTRFGVVASMFLECSDDSAVIDRRGRSRPKVSDHLETTSSRKPTVAPSIQQRQVADAPNLSVAAAANDGLSLGIRLSLKSSSSFGVSKDQLRAYYLV
jgi:hypothetical protein